ncbi:MAG TPA: beta-ketoacyl synthase N-terminal-like domain-containing protein, partial [Bacillota bacterium]|nr:beta-ketoacyl synthase N-terminal-like domain-containing protein [Bacillota bacterium]
MKRRVVITGAGVVSPLGHDVESFWDNIKKGQSGIKCLNADEYKDINTKIAGIIEDFPNEYLDMKEIKRADPFIQYGYAAAIQAVEQSNIDLEKVDRDRIGVYIGS